MSKGLPDWKKLYRRVLTMSPKEITVRLQQQVTARVDLIRHKLGIGFEPRLLVPSSARAEPRFFFSPDAIPLLCSHLRQVFPEETESIIERAERICAHRFDLLGYRDLDYGQEIDWHRDLVHGKSAPRKPWFQIRYLDFGEVGDSKITWELNRHQHFVILAKAFRLTGDAKYASELFRQWEQWHQQNPYPIGINWASSLEVAFRSLSWLWMYFLMSGSQAMPYGFRSELCRKLAVSARHIECYLSTYFSPNTHLLGEGVALFFIGTLCPELRSAERWQRRGWEIVRQEARHQVRDDGLHFEQSTYYHVYALDFFLHALVLASLNGIEVPPHFSSTIERMLEALCVLGRAGPVPRLGDDDGGRLFDPQRSRTAHLLDPLATGAVLFTRADFKAVAGGLREETLWLLGETGKAEFDRLPTAVPAHDSTGLQASGLFVMTDGDLKRQLAVDAGPQGADSAGHGHADALSLTANCWGKPLLIDSGTFEYVGPGRERDRFRGTRAHNTMVVDGLDQSDPKGPFSWVSLPKVTAEGWIKGEFFDLFVGSHHGYTRLPEPVVHRRFVFARKGHYWMVRDLALGEGTHQLDFYWHIDPELSPVEGAHGTFRGASVGLSIQTPEEQRSTREVLSEDWSPVYGQKDRHAVLHFGTRAELPKEFFTLIRPETGSNSRVVSFTRVSAPSTTDSAACYRLRDEREEHNIVFGQGKPWTLPPWASDADFLCWGQNHNETERILICCNASYVKVNGEPIMSSASRILRCEIVSIEGKVRVISSGQDAVVNTEAFSAISLEPAGT